MRILKVIKIMWFWLVMIVCGILTVTAAPIVWLLTSDQDHNNKRFAWRPVITETESGWVYLLWLVWVRVTWVATSDHTGYYSYVRVRKNED